jgi:heme oxygenase
MEEVPAMRRLVAHDLSMAEYVAVLQHMHAFLGRFEPMIAAAMTGSPAAALLDGERPRALAEDLARLGAPLIDNAPIEGLHALRGEAEGLGALYVVEGSGLGGRVIGRHVQASLGLGPGTGGLFYGGLGAEAARARWALLGAALEACPQADHARAVASADTSFHALDRWMRRISLA